MLFCRCLIILFLCIGFLCACLFPSRSHESSDGNHFGLEEVLLDVAVRHHRAHAVFAESRRLHAQTQNQVLDGRKHVAVALELHHHKVASAPFLPRLEILETYVEIDGQPLRLAPVDQRDAVEPVLQHRLEVLVAVGRHFAQEGVTLCASYFRGRLHLDAFFLCASMVVFRLHLQKREVGVDDKSAPLTFLRARAAIVMSKIERIVFGRVPVDGPIGRDAFAVNLLGEIVARLPVAEQGKQGKLVRRRICCPCGSSAVLPTSVPKPYGLHVVYQCFYFIVHFLFHIVSILYHFVLFSLFLTALRFIPPKDKFFFQLAAQKVDNIASVFSPKCQFLSFLCSKSRHLCAWLK
jgi:hypothetical protein